MASWPSATWIVRPLLRISRRGNVREGSLLYLGEVVIRCPFRDCSLLPDCTRKECIVADTGAMAQDEQALQAASPSMLRRGRWGDVVARYLFLICAILIIAIIIG